MEALIRRHTAVTFTVAFTGCAPGFAYMKFDDPAFDVPRSKSQWVRIPAGSVALRDKKLGGISFRAYKVMRSESSVGSRSLCRHRCQEEYKRD
ncbi:carboxyltransferase domain-containing protein [Mesorhizobium sp. M0959]|uniref:carboxyltransferase domain-containing protein n=1 Tax=Mesorhizobium sp. M0959 TaxID=2957034 RepID=UPI00333E0ECF